MFMNSRRKDSDNGVADYPRNHETVGGSDISLFHTLAREDEEDIFTNLEPQQHQSSPIIMEKEPSHSESFDDDNKKDWDQKQHQQQGPTTSKPPCVPLSTVLRWFILLILLCFIVFVSCHRVCSSSASNRTFIDINDTTDTASNYGPIDNHINQNQRNKNNNDMAIKVEEEENHNALNVHQSSQRRKAFAEVTYLSASHVNKEDKLQDTTTSSTTTTTTTTTASTNTKSVVVADNLPVPVAHREEDRVVYIGSAPSGWPNNVPRQAADSEYDLIDPPEELSDPYGWLRNNDIVLKQDNPAESEPIINYINEENTYSADAYFSKPAIQDLQQEINEEMMSYMHDTYFSFPTIDEDTGHYYYTRTFEGKAHGVNCRAPVPDPPEEDFIASQLALWNGTAEMPILHGEVAYLDQNDLADGYDYFKVGDVKVKGDYVAYTVDKTAYEHYELVIQNINTGEVLLNGADYGLDRIAAGFRWGEQSHHNMMTFYVVKREVGTNRHYKVSECTISFSGGIVSDVNVQSKFHETNVKFEVGTGLTTDKKYLLIYSTSKDTTEIRAYNNENGQLTLFGRSPGIEYDIDHGNSYWWMLTNKDSMNYTLMRAHDNPVGNLNWQKVSLRIDNQPKDCSIMVKNDYIMISGRDTPFGLPQIWIAKFQHPMNKKNIESVTPLLNNAFARSCASESNIGPTHYIDVVDTGGFDASTIVVSYQSMTSPARYYSINLDHIATDSNIIIPPKKSQPTNNVALLFATEVPGYDRTSYCSHRMLVPSRIDSNGKSVMIPVSVLYHRDAMNEANNIRPVPLHLYGYGAYGQVIDDRFDAKKLSLLDRGIIYAVAGIRGSGDLGQGWYHDGKLLNKKNTFHDFIDVAKYLIDAKNWTTSDMLGIEGRSAGGLLMGATINEEPGLFKAAILGVPFVDCVATLSDGSIPLTATEWEEWGNPNEDHFYEYMLSYDPINNIKPNTIYPSMFITSGLYDSRVAYWEPTKYTATVRKTLGLTDPANTYPVERPIFLNIEAAGGHFGGNNRFSSIDSKAMEYAYIVDQLQALNWVPQPEDDPDT